MATDDSLDELLELTRDGRGGHLDISAGHECDDSSWGRAEVVPTQKLPSEGDGRVQHFGRSSPAAVHKLVSSPCISDPPHERPTSSEMASDRSHRRHHMKKHHAVKESSESEDSEVSPKNSSRSPGVSTDSRKKKSATMLSVFGVPSLPATEARRRALNSVSNRNIHQRPMDAAAIGEPAGVLEGEVIRKSRRERTESTEGAPRQRIEDEQRVHHRVHEERAQDSNQARNAEKLTSGSVGAVGRVTGDIGFSDAKEAALSAGDPLRTTVAAYVVEDDAKKKKKKKRKKKKKSKKKKKRKKKKKSKRKKKKKKSKKKKKKRKKKKSKKKKKKKKKKKSQSPDSTATSAASSSPTVSQAPPTSQTSLPATKVGLASTPSTRSTQTDDLLRSMRSRIQREAYLPPPNEGPRHSRRHRRRSSSEGSGSSSGSVKKYRIVTHVVLGNPASSGSSGSQKSCQMAPLPQMPPQNVRSRSWSRQMMRQPEPPPEVWDRPVQRTSSLCTNCGGPITPPVAAQRPVIIKTPLILSRRSSRRSVRDDDYDDEPRRRSRSDERRRRRSGSRRSSHSSRSSRNRCHCSRSSSGSPSSGSRRSSRRRRRRRRRYRRDKLLPCRMDREITGRLGSSMLKVPPLDMYSRMLFGRPPQARSFERVPPRYGPPVMGDIPCAPLPPTEGAPPVSLAITTNMLPPTVPLPPALPPPMPPLRPQLMPPPMLPSMGPSPTAALSPFLPQLRAHSSFTVQPALGVPQMMQQSQTRRPPTKQRSVTIEVGKGPELPSPTTNMLPPTMTSPRALPPLMPPLRPQLMPPPVPPHMLPSLGPPPTAGLSPFLTELRPHSSHTRQPPTKQRSLTIEVGKEPKLPAPTAAVPTSYQASAPLLGKQQTGPPRAETTTNSSDSIKLLYSFKREPSSFSSTGSTYSGAAVGPPVKRPDSSSWRAPYNFVQRSFNQGGLAISVIFVLGIVACVLALISQSASGREGRGRDVIDEEGDEGTLMHGPWLFNLSGAASALVMRAYKLCHSSDCKSEATRLANVLASEPCDSFYDYVCKRRWALTPITLRSADELTLNDIQDNVWRHIELFKTKRNAATAAWTSCVNTAAINELGSTPFQEVLNSSGLSGWPFEKAPVALNPWRAAGRLMRLLTLASLLSLSVEPGPRPSLTILLGPAEAPLSLRDFRDNSTTTSFLKRVERSISFLSPDGNKTAKRAMEVLNFVVRLASINSGKQTAPAFAAKAPFTTFLDAALGDLIDLKNKNVHAKLQSPKYGSEVSQMMAVVPLRSALNYLGYYAVDHLWAFSPTSVGDVVPPLQRQRICLQMTERAVPRQILEIGYKVYKTRLNLTHLRRQANETKRRLEESIRSLSWMDHQMKLKVIERVQRTTVEFAFPSELLLPGSMPDVPPPLPSRTTGALSLYQRCVENEFVSSVKRIINGDDVRQPRSLFSQRIELSPDGVLHVPLVAVNPSTSAKATSGYVSLLRDTRLNVRLARALMEAALGRTSDDRSVWSPLARARYRGKQACFLARFPTLLDPLEGLEVHKPAEAVAKDVLEHVAVALAHLEFRQAVQPLRGNMTDYRLADAQTLSSEQLFFISYAESACEAYDDESAFRHFLLRKESPARQRVDLALAHDPTFHHAFHCPRGSAMRPRHSCSFW